MPAACLVYYDFFCSLSDAGDSVCFTVTAVRRPGRRRFQALTDSSAGGTTDTFRLNEPGTGRRRDGALTFDLSFSSLKMAAMTASSSIRITSSRDGHTSRRNTSSPCDVTPAPCTDNTLITLISCSLILSPTSCYTMIVVSFLMVFVQFRAVFHQCSSMTLTDTATLNSALPTSLFFL